MPQSIEQLEATIQRRQAHGLDVHELQETLAGRKAAKAAEEERRQRLNEKREESKKRKEEAEARKQAKAKALSAVQVPRLTPSNAASLPSVRAPRQPPAPDDNAEEDWQTYEREVCDATRGEAGGSGRREGDEEPVETGRAVNLGVDGERALGRTRSGRLYMSSDGIEEIPRVPAQANPPSAPKSNPAAAKKRKTPAKRKASEMEEEEQDGEDLRATSKFHKYRPFDPSFLTDLEEWYKGHGQIENMTAASQSILISAAAVGVSRDHVKAKQEANRQDRIRNEILMVQARVELISAESLVEFADESTAQSMIDQISACEGRLVRLERELARGGDAAPEADSQEAV